MSVRKFNIYKVILMVSSSSRRRFQSIHKKLERTKVRSDKTKYNKICSPCLMKFSGILIFWHIKLKGYYDKHWSLIILITCEDDTLPFTMFLRNSKGRKAQKEYVCVCFKKVVFFLHIHPSSKILTKILESLPHTSLESCK